MVFKFRHICLFCILVLTFLSCCDAKIDDDGDICRLELKELRARLDQLEEKFSKLSQKYTDSSHHGNITRRLLESDLVPKKIAFNARVSTKLGTVAHNQVIVFGRVDTNIGQAYNPNSGVFRCSQGGVYLFSVTIVAFVNKGAEFTLVKNGTPIGYIYACSDSGRCDDSGSNTFITELSAGDDVWVKIHQTYHDDGEIIDPAFSSFSGVYLY